MLIHYQKLSISTTTFRKHISFDPSNTIRALRTHWWTIYDAQHLVLTILAIFVSVIEQPGALVKTFIAILLMVSLLMPITRQFFLPFLPIASWLVLFYSCRYVNRGLSE